MIFTKRRDPRFITFRRGGTLSDANHHLLAIWATACVEHVPHYFEQAQPGDKRPRYAIAQARAWVRGKITMSQVRTAAGQAAVVAHVAAHELGAAAYAIKAVQAAAQKDEREQAGCQECQWQREQLPVEIRELVLDDQRLRNQVCWFVFNC